MKKLLTLSLLFFLYPLNFVFTQGSSDPPSLYEDKGACPFECCTYKEWKTTNKTTLFAKPNSYRKIATLQKDEFVYALTGIVYTRPQKMKVILNYESSVGSKVKFKRGDFIYALTEEGEGYFTLWHQGKILKEVYLNETEILGETCSAINEHRKKFNYKERCWAIVLDKKWKSIWWVKMKTKNGKIGWTKETQNFEGQDSCG